MSIILVLEFDPVWPTVGSVNDTQLNSIPRLFRCSVQGTPDDMNHLHPEPLYPVIVVQNRSWRQTNLNPVLTPDPQRHPMIVTQ